MKNLKEYIKEGLFDDLDKIEKVGGMESNAEQLKKEIIDWIIKNNKERIYKNKIKIDTTTTPWTVDYEDNIQLQQSITSLNNDGMFQWGRMGGSFSCINCQSLTSLKGAPKEVERNFECSWCQSLTSLEGAPKEVGWGFDCVGCISLKSLEGSPEKSWSFNCKFCDNLESLKGGPKEVIERFDCGNTNISSLQYAPKTPCISCSNCENLKSLNGCPKKLECFHCASCTSLKSLKGGPEVVGMIFNCRFTSITSLEGAPKEVGIRFICNGCKTTFTEEDVRKVVNVKGDIIV